jgi:outer membrane protein OmpA-like peptidoglycan-associated protein
VLLAASVAPLAALSGCGSGHPVETPVQWWHHLQGGAIAQSRPPPPGADLPYPHVFTIPPKPEIPSPAFRQTVETELTQDRDTTERLLARTPIDLSVVPPPPPRQTLAKPPAAGTAPAPPSDDTANATLPAADAKPAPAPQVAARAAPGAAPDGGPLPGTPLTLVGTAPDLSGLPSIPDSPPPPPTFESVAAQPAPTPPPPLPAPAPPAPNATRILFGTGDATLNVSQKDSLGDVANLRGKGSIAVEGHGEANSDTPGAQEQAVQLGLKRAQAIADALIHDHKVPADKILLSATAFGRDALVRDQ